MASRREKEKEKDAGGQGTSGSGASASGSSSSSTATEERRPDQGQQTEGRTGGNGSAAGSEGSTAVERSGSGEQGGRRAATRGGGGRLGGSALASWPVLLRAGVSASPWELVRRMSEDINQLFDTLRLNEVGAAPALAGSTESRTARGTARGTGLSSRGLFAPPIEVQQRDDAVVVRLDLPGVAADEIDITVENGMLIISGERRQEHREEREGLVRTEISYGTFHRAIPLPEGADEDRLTAQLNNGTLEIIVPIAFRERGRRVQVQQSS